MFKGNFGNVCEPHWTCSEVVVTDGGRTEFRTVTPDSHLWLGLGNKSDVVLVWERSGFGVKAYLAKCCDIKRAWADK